MKKTIIIFTFILICCLKIKSQNTDFELLTSRTWIFKNLKQFVGIDSKAIYNKNNIMINIYDLYVDGQFLEKRKITQEFYLSDTPDKVFDEKKKKNKRGKYIIKKNNKTKEITQTEIISITKDKLITNPISDNNKAVVKVESTGIDKIDIK